MAVEDVERALIDVALAEFAALRDEIKRRSDAQHILMSLNITTVGTIGGLVLSDPSGRRPLLLMLPVLCSALALVWIDHHHAIKRLGAYIDGVLRPILQEVAHNKSVMSWERSWHRMAGSASGLTLVAAPHSVLFLGPPIAAATVVTWREVHGEGVKALWWTGVGAIAVQLITWGFVLWPAIRARWSESPQRG